MLNFFTNLNSYLWGWVMLVLLLGTHIMLTIRLKVPQRWVFKGIKLSLTKGDSSKGETSQFSALATSLAATIGTGNIIGVAAAISLGGPGAVLWCWLTGVFGIATKYAESLLAIKYRVKDEKGRYHGGAMYALERGLGWKWMARLFAVFAAISTFGIVSIPSNAIVALVGDEFGVPAIVGAIVLCTLVVVVLMGGVKSISKVCAALVPIMALVYVGGCIALLCINAEYLWPAIRLIAVSAFNPAAIGGGLAGGGVMLAARYGIARGLYSNESGLGSAPIVAATARTPNPVHQALISSTSTFWDTVVICAMTGIALVSSILASPEIGDAEGLRLTQLAFDKIPYIGRFILDFGLVTFSFSSIIGWEIYGERSVIYLSRDKAASFYRIIFIVLIFISCLMNLRLLWEISDTFNALMAIPNLLAIIFLSKVIVDETRKYLWSGRINDKAEDMD